MQSDGGSWIHRVWYWCQKEQGSSPGEGKRHSLNFIKVFCLYSQTAVFLLYRENPRLITIPSHIKNVGSFLPGGSMILRRSRGHALGKEGLCFQEFIYTKYTKRLSF